MYVDVYALQNVPPSNINRDDTGSPKTAMYGGKLRARVSSQAWKRAMRKEFESTLPKNSLGVRTKFAVQLVASKIRELEPGYSQQAEDLAKQVLGLTGLKIVESKRSGEVEGSASTEYLVFIARSEIAALAQIAIEWEREGIKNPDAEESAEKKAKEAFHGAQAVDIALFGRMVAGKPDFKIDASAQVAHAISVDEVKIDYDYFTALDDCAPKDNDGVAMIETTAFDSSTLYRYATVNVASLYKQLGDVEATAAGVGAFVEAFARSMPTGKSNAFANWTLPSALYVALRERQPVNAVNAFEVPVRASADCSISCRAAVLLEEKLAEIDDAFGTSPRKAWCVRVGAIPQEPAAAWEMTSLDGLLDELREEVRASCGAGEER